MLVLFPQGSWVDARSWQVTDSTLNPGGYKLLYLCLQMTVRSSGHMSYYRSGLHYIRCCKILAERMNQVNRGLVGWVIDNREGMHCAPQC